MASKCASRGRVARASLRLDAEIARRSFHRYSTYRAATFAGCVTNTVFGFLQAYVLLAVVDARGQVGGLGPTQVVTFVFVTQGLLATVGAFGELELSERIRSGDVVVDLHRPVDLQTYWLSHDLGRAAFQGFARGIPPFVIGALAFTLQTPGSAAQWIAFAASVVLAVVVGFAIRFTAVLSGFWILDARGAVQLVAAVTMFFSGFIVPVNFFPPWLADVAWMLPFVAVLQLPVEVFLGQTSAVGGVAGALAIQAFWAVVLVLAGRRMLAVATRKVVVQGG